ncbi:hypothetical protein NA57DRAFT_55435 [Rhizodiscina lignyota]|uniref:Amino acid transporter n=1 Tax=Rhizodiscina lignyota TaxID=1504668 RepID=A0A9P4IDA0_9PEZI|nr:hypothetical protein NA57DRAFT_55435 [Rhizodiscina lignyota]
MEVPQNNTGTGRSTNPPFTDVSGGAGSQSWNTAISGPGTQGSKSSSQKPLRPYVEPLTGSTPTQSGDDDFSKELFPPDHVTEVTAFTESTVVPRRNLGFLQTTSLMLNGSLGGGFFFTTPGFVLALVPSKRICIVLWIVGGIYTYLGATIFAEYGTALPYNGGALVYFDEVFHRPRMLATVIFSVWWILFATTEGNCKGIAQTILSLANGQSSFEPSLGLLNFTAVVIQTVVCLILFFARRLVFAFNTIIALFKIILMVFIFVAGMVHASRGSNSGFKDFNKEYPGYSNSQALTAMVYIILCYQGWDNANYVTGEVHRTKQTLKWARITSISIIGVLNTLATLAFYSVADFATVTNADGQANSALQWAQIVFGSSRGMNIATGIASFGTLVFITYTTAKVKQAIAWQRIIPFSNFFGRQDPYFDSPGGGLFLHWIISVIAILALGDMGSESRLFFSGIYSWGYQVMFVFLGIGLLRLEYRMRLYDDNWRPSYLKNKFVLIFVAAIFVGINIVILVITALPNDPGQVACFYWPVAIAGTVVFSVMYWGILRVFQPDNSKHRKALASRVGFEVNVYELGDEVPDDMRFAMYEAGLDGSKRRVQYKVSGPISRCLSIIQSVKNSLLRFLAY